jgi:cystathionine beta-synthase
MNIIADAERRGLLRPGGTIVEATSGNTGMGLSMVAAIRGYSCIFVMPDKMSQEKIASLKAFGAKVVICPTAVDPEDPRSYYSVSRRIVEETAGSFYANQYHNPANPEAHYVSTAPDLGADRWRMDIFAPAWAPAAPLQLRALLQERSPLQDRRRRSIGSSLRYGDMPTHPFLPVEGIGEGFLPRR